MNPCPPRKRAQGAPRLVDIRNDPGAATRPLLRRLGRVGIAGELALDDIGKDGDHLLRAFGDGERGGVDLLQRVAVFGLVENDDRLALRCGIAGIEGGVPLLVFFAEADDDDVGLLDQGARTDGVDLGALVVVPELVRFLPENGDAAIVGGLVMGDRRREGDIELGGLGAVGDLLAPVGVDFAGKIDARSHGVVSLISVIRNGRTARGTSNARKASVRFGYHGMGRRGKGEWNAAFSCFNRQD